MLDPESSLRKEVATPVPEEHRMELREDPVTSLNMVSMNASAWGGIWQAEGRDGGRLGIPVSAGLRRGWVAGQLTVKPTAEGSLLIYRVDKSDYQLQKPAVLTLLLASLGAAVTLVAPLIPSLLGFVPIGILLGIAAWFLVIARLRNSGPEEFFEDLSQEPDQIDPQTDPQD